MNDDETLEFTRWRMSVDHRLDNIDTRFQSFNVQHGAMEKSIEQTSLAVEMNTREIGDLKADIQSVVDLVRIGNDKTDAAVELLIKNKDDILDAIGAVQVVKGGWRFAEGVGKFSRPFIVILGGMATGIGALAYGGKAALAWAAAHLPPGIFK